MPLNDTIQSPQELEFAIFCIESIAAKLGVEPEQVFQALDEKSDLLCRYVVPNYDVLHTQGKEYIVEDILSVMKEEGITI